MALLVRPSTDRPAGQNSALIAANRTRKIDALVSLPEEGRQLGKGDDHVRLRKAEAVGWFFDLTLSPERRQHRRSRAAVIPGSVECNPAQPRKRVMR